MELLKTTSAINTEIVIIIIAGIWLYTSSEVEALIIIIAALVPLIFAIVDLQGNDINVRMSIEDNGKGKKPTRPSNLTPRDVQGNFTPEIGNYIGKRLLFWQYKLNVINDSDKNLFYPILYISDVLQYLVFTGDLKSEDPISGANKVVLKFKFEEMVNGTPEEREQVYIQKYPTVMKEKLKLILEFKDERGKARFYSFGYDENKWRGRFRRQLPSNYVKARIYS